MGNKFVKMHLLRFACHTKAHNGRKVHHLSSTNRTTLAVDGTTGESGTSTTCLDFVTEVKILRSTRASEQWIKSLTIMSLQNLLTWYKSTKKYLCLTPDFITFLQPKEVHWVWGWSKHIPIELWVPSGPNLMIRLTLWTWRWWQPVGDFLKSLLHAPGPSRNAQKESRAFKQASKQEIIPWR